MKKFLFFLSTLFVANGLMAQVLIDGLYYNLDEDNKTASVTGHYSDFIITIPESVTYNNVVYDVTSIGKNAFRGWDIREVTIPYGVTSIGEYAFNGTSLESVTIPYGISSIEDWAFCRCRHLRSITLPNSVTIIGEGAFEEAGLSSIEIPEGVTSIGVFAFAYCDYLSSIVIPSSVTSIGGEAFANSKNLYTITCMAKTPPALSPDEYVFDYEVRVFSSFVERDANVTVYVPYDAVSAYKAAKGWNLLNIQPIPAENVSLSTDEVAVNVEKTTAGFSMPINASADSYTLTIKNNGVTFCTLTFNAQGQLANIDFSTTKSYELKADVSAFKFTVTGLSEATDYGYSFKALSSSKSVLKEYTGSFTTKNADGTGGSSQGGQGIETSIEGVSNATTVAIVGNQILVNGEAPEFVVTVSGKKIANQNLKSGVYFVNVEGETVKVVK